MNLSKLQEIVKDREAKQPRDRFTLLPDFIEKIRQNRIEEKAKRIAKEFGMQSAPKQTTRFVRYEADNPSSCIGEGFTVRSALHY